MAALGVIFKVASVAGTVMNTAGNLAAAEDTKNIANINTATSKNIAEYNAAINNQAAGQEEAAAQIRAKEAKRQARLQQSRVLALAAASGGGAMDTDVMNIIAGFEEEGDLAARTELYQGSENARRLKTEGESGIWQAGNNANVIRYKGLSESSAYKRRAFSTFMGGSSSLASKYGAFTNA